MRSWVRWRCCWVRTVTSVILFIRNQMRPEKYEASLNYNFQVLCTWDYDRLHVWCRQGAIVFHFWGQFCCYLCQVSFTALRRGVYLYFEQIYGDTSASSNDCFKMFNPVDTATFKVHKILYNTFTYEYRLELILTDITLTSEGSQRVVQSIPRIIWDGPWPTEESWGAWEIYFHRW